MPLHSRIQYLKGIHKWYNEHEFNNELNSITVLLKRQSSKDGWYEYSAHRDWTPIVNRLGSASIVISDGCFTEGTEEATMVHEMIHQWQCEVLNEAPHHNKKFNRRAKALGKKYGYTV